MLGLLNKVWRPGLLILVAVAFFLGAYFFFYRDSYTAPPTVDIPFERIAPPSSSFSTFVEIPPIRQGVLLLDVAHSNDFVEGEIGSLMSRVEDRGYIIEFLGERDHQNFRPPGLAQRLALLDEKLRQADSFAVILPQEAYNKHEMDIVEKYVDKGGKLLLIGDPTRRHHINTLAESFGIAFRPDYLYNTIEYDINFQNVFIRDFHADELTGGLKQIALYTAGSIKFSETGLAFTDGNTRSSMLQSIQPLYPMVKGGEGRVLAISDMTFMIPPQNAILDNDRLISNIADYLTESQRQFDLGDFPHFFKDDVDILLGRASLFDVGTEVKSTLAAFGIDSGIRGVEDLEKDTVFFGLYEDAPDVAQYLEVAGVQVDDDLRTPFTPEIATSGTAIILLHRAQERHVLVVLGDSPGALVDVLGRLQSGQFRSGMVSEVLGVYRIF